MRFVPNWATGVAQRNGGRNETKVEEEESFRDLRATEGVGKQTKPNQQRRTPCPLHGAVSKMSPKTVIDTFSRALLRLRKFSKKGKRNTHARHLR